jgi:hypothetical protein
MSKVFISAHRTKTTTPGYGLASAEVVEITSGLILLDARKVGSIEMSRLPRNWPI